MRAVVVPTLALLLLSPAAGAAEWQIKPFLGVAFGGSTTLVDLANAAGGPNIVIGVNGALLGNIFGIDMDFAHAPGFFQQGDQHLVLSSSATTLTCNVVMAPPRHVTEYALGPYFVFGGGLMHASIDDFGSVFPCRGRSRRWTWAGGPTATCPTGSASTGTRATSGASAASRRGASASAPSNCRSGARAWRW
jgi:hypothetical protein